MRDFFRAALASNARPIPRICRSATDSTADSESPAAVAQKKESGTGLAKGPPELLHRDKTGTRSERAHFWGAESELHARSAPASRFCARLPILAAYGANCRSPLSKDPAAAMTRRPGIIEFMIALAITIWAGAQTSALAQIAHDHGGPLPHNIPDFCAVSNPIRSTGSGPWLNSATWGGTVPGPNSVVVIDMGHSITLDGNGEAAVLCIEGSLAFSREVNTRLTVGTMLIMRSGTLEIGTAGAPIPADKTAEIVIANAPLNDPELPGYDAGKPADPDQFGTGILGVGTTRIHGSPKTPTWTRLASEPRAGDTTLKLSSSVTGWRPGDRLILPDTRHLKFDEVANWTRTDPQWEELAVQSISADGKVITLDRALQFDHWGARDADGQLRLLPHVGNLSRNVVIRSEVPIGSAGVQGHVIFTERADVDVRYAALLDLGRTRAEATAPHTNQIGRYAMHFHHLMGPAATLASGYQYAFVGNAIDGGSTFHNRRWAVAIHNTHFGLVADNVAYNYAGALINTEDGSESYNVIERNFVVRGSGTGGRLGHGNEGMGFWFRGPNNYVRGNVAADFDSDDVEAAYGFKYFMHGACQTCDSLADIKIPTAPGQDMSEYVTVDGNNLPILQFENNEVYSAAEGLTYWWLSSKDPVPSANPKPSVFKNLRIWHVYNVGIYHYPGTRVLFDGLQIFGESGHRVDRPGDLACCGRGFHGEDYAATDVRIVNSEIHNMWTGIIPSSAGTGLQVVENSYIKSNMWSDIGIDHMFSANGGGWLPARRIILNNVQLAGNTTISKDWATNRAPENLNDGQTDQLLVYSYQGNPANNFEVFYKEQESSSIAGGIAPCGDTRPEIGGIVCSTDASNGPVITWLDPWIGSTSGGTTVQISGAGFQPGAIVTFDGVPATVVSNTRSKLTVNIPPHGEAAVSVRVANVDGKTDALPATYTADAGDVPIGFLYSAAVPPPGGGNHPPVAKDDTATGEEDKPLIIPVLVNDVDDDHDTLTVSRVTQGAHGSVAINGDGTVTYTPNANFNGDDSFSYAVSDGKAESAYATVRVTITPVNDDPTANPDTATTNEDSPVDIPVLTNDTDVDGISLSVVSVTNGLHGSTSVNPDGTVRYTPVLNYNGADSFTYTISDGAGGSATGTVSVTVTPVNDAPTIAAVANQKGVVGTPVSPVTLVGTDVDGDLLTYSEAGLPPGLNLDPQTGEITGTPTKAGDYIVTVSVFDASESASTTFAWHIEAAPTVTLENPGPQKNLEGEHVWLQLETNAPWRDSAGNHRRFSASGLPPGLHIGPHSGVIHGYLGKRSSGVYDVEATVTLGAESATVKFQWTVIDTNRRPVIKPPKNQTNFEHDSVWLQIDATDPDGDRLQYSATGLPPGLRIHPRTGEVEGHLPPNASAGTYTVTVTVSGGSKSATANFKWLVEPLPQPKRGTKG
jgi:VCBS repeat-containing protein